MDWQLIILPLILLGLVALSVVVKSWLAGEDHAPRHDSVDEAMAVTRARGGPPPG